MNHHTEEHEHEHCECGCHEHHEVHEHCGCGHGHYEEHEHCGCGHDHHEEHEHCDCGHDHHEEHEHCDCGHDHHEEHERCDCGHDHHEEHTPTVYIVENLGCPNCAAKMEAKINELPGVHAATITFATKQLTLSADHPKALIPEITAICNSIESGIVIKEKQDTKKESADSKQEKLAKKKKDRLTLGMIIVGAVLFALFEIYHEVTHMESFPIPLIIGCIAVYALLGWRVVFTAVRNLFKGQIFDENFLMTVATIGALAIGSYLEAIGVMLFFRVGEFFEHVAVERSRSQIMDAVDLRPEVVNLIHGDTVTTIDADEAVPGDVLLVRAGDRIPLDSVIIEGDSRIDTSPVTGEPVPVHATVGDAVISGCVNTSGVLKVRVEKPLEESMVTKILNSVENAAASKPKIDRFITRFARIYTPCVVLLAVATAVLPPLFSGQASDGSIWYKWVYTALTFLVMSCPCALVLSVPLAFFSGIGTASKRGILFKGGVAVEALANIKAVVMDKTGTITEGNFDLQTIEPVSGYTKEQLLSYAAAAESASSHPIAVSITNAAAKMNLALEKPSDLKEIAGHGLVARISAGTLLCGNQKLMHEHHVDLSAYKPEHTGAEVLVALNDTYIGHLVIADTIKPESAAAINRIKQSGIVTAMLTGDAEGAANAVAKKTGVQEVHAKLLPEDKVNRLADIRAHHGAVMFVGDGINDAPVLAGADIGAAMGSGADAAIEAADVVFMNSNLDAIPDSIRIAKLATRIALQNVWFALIVKIFVMILGVTGIYSNMWLAVFADTGVAVICIINSIRILLMKK